MIVFYDWKLVVLSVIVAMLGAHAGFTILTVKAQLRRVPYKLRLAAGATTIGVGVWSMHFIGMLALHVPAEINYLVLPTLISALVAVVLTGLGLYAATSGRLPRHGCLVGAVLSGLGISSMHYIGMEAVRAACQVSYSPSGVVASVALSIAVAWLAFRFVTAGRHSPRNTVFAALLLGMAIASMHYVAMLGTQFAFVEGALVLSRPALNDTYLGVVVAVLTFLLFDVFLLLTLPSEMTAASARSTDASANRTARRAAGPSLSWRADTALAGAYGAGVDTLRYDVPLVRWSIASGALAQPPSLRLSSRVFAGAAWRDAADAESGDAGEAHPATPTAPEASIRVTHKGQVSFVNVADVLFASAEGRYTHVGFQDEQGRFEQHFCDRSISTLTETLAAFGFRRTHRSHLVNMKRVAGHQRRGDGGQIVFVCADAPRIPISRSKYPAACREIERLKGVV